MVLGLINGLLGLGGSSPSAPPPPAAGLGGPMMGPIQQTTGPISFQANCSSQRNNPYFYPYMPQPYFYSPMPMQMMGGMGMNPMAPMPIDPYSQMYGSMNGYVPVDPYSQMYGGMNGYGYYY